MANLQAGRELDALVAEKVMGSASHARASHDVPGLTCSLCREAALPYSTSIAAAWEVVEKLSDKWEMNLRTILPARDYVCEFKLVVKNKCIVDAQHPFEHVWNNPVDTAPLAICLAALKAVGAWNQLYRYEEMYDI